MAHEPVSAAEASLLFTRIAAYPHIAAAVSGGSDSIALMWLLARWRTGRAGNPKLTVLTVDHALRRESAEEARQTLQAAATQGLPAIPLRWKGAKPRTGLQDAAREARYRLMTDWCVRNAVPALLTAHTLEDQAETFLMRLARGSGLDGLAGIRDTEREGVAILRPLLGVSRERLRATLRAAGIGWSEDESNEDERFERVRWRKALRLLAPGGVTSIEITRSAARLNRAREALDACLGPLIATAVTVAGGTAGIDSRAYDGAPEELRVRLLKHVLESVGGETPELAAVERLESYLKSGAGKARTLAGCKVVRRGAQVSVTRERPRGRRVRRPEMQA